jgi:hypothetical protein
MNLELTTVVVLISLIAAFNPCSLGVSVLSVASLLGVGKHPKHAGSHLFVLSSAASLLYAALGIVLTATLLLVPTSLRGFFAVLVGLWVIIVGLIEIKDYFWYGRGISFKMTDRVEKKIYAWTKTHHGHGKGFMLGLYSTVHQLHYTGGLLAASSVIIALSQPTGVVALYSVVWAVVYSLPILLIAASVLYGVQLYNIAHWRENSKAGMRLAIGLLHVLVGWVLIALSTGGLRII